MAVQRQLRRSGPYRDVTVIRHRSHASPSYRHRRFFTLFPPCSSTYRYVTEGQLGRILSSGYAFFPLYIVADVSFPESLRACLHIDVRCSYSQEGPEH